MPKIDEKKFEEFNDTIDQRHLPSNAIVNKSISINRYILYTCHVSSDIPRGEPSFSLLVLLSGIDCSGGGTAAYILHTTKSSSTFIASCHFEIKYVEYIHCHINNILAK